MLVKSSFITKYIYTKIQITYKGSFFEASLKSFIIIILVNINTYKVEYIIIPHVSYSSLLEKPRIQMENL